MKIKQVEELVGITKKNIRFYEEQGLLNVERAQNGYREYSMDDIKRLREIKLLRKLAVPIEEMKAVFEKRISPLICMEKQLSFIEEQKKHLTQMYQLCEGILSNQQSLDTLDAEHCLEEMEKMEKEGARFMDVSRTDIRRKKRTGAIAGAIVMTMMMLMIIALLLWANGQEPIPLLLLLFFIAFPTAVIISTLIALAERMKEIEGGEEDEASKY